MDRLRAFLLGVILVGAVGLVAELLLLEHFDEWRQWVPLVLLGATILLGAVVGVRPTDGAVRAFRLVMMLCLVAGAIGVWFHYQGNVEFEVERDGSLRGLPLFWEAIRGATPALAPGALAQLGLLGLVWAHFHPAVRGRSFGGHDEPREGR